MPGGPGTFHIKTGNADQSVVQLANLTPEKFMYGGLIGFDLTVTVVEASGRPETVLEATFEGTLKGNAGEKLNVTEGRFVYRESAAGSPDVVAFFVDHLKRQQRSQKKGHIEKPCLDHDWF